MLRKKQIPFLIASILVLAVSCQPNQEAEIANPASVFCKENGGMLELRQVAEGGVSGICHFPDGSECEEWAFFRGECAPASQGSPEAEKENTGTPAPSETSAALPVDPAAYEGWTTYTNSDYGFSIMLPEDWAAEEPGASDPLLDGHALFLHPQAPSERDISVRMTFRHAGEEVLLWPTGVGAGEFLPQGTLAVEGVTSRRILFVCPNGEINAVWYHGAEDANPNLRLGDVEFGFIASRTGSYCADSTSLSGEEQKTADMIVASLRPQ